MFNHAIKLKFKCERSITQESEEGGIPCSTVSLSKALIIKSRIDPSGDSIWENMDAMSGS